MKFQTMLSLQKRFCLIDSPIPFALVCNPCGTYDLRNETHEFVGDRTDISGSDICNRPAGAWQFDIYHLLPEKYFKENPAFKVALCYDDSLLAENQSVNVDYSDIDLGEGVAGVNGQDVQDVELQSIVSLIDLKIDKIIDSKPLPFHRNISFLNDFFENGFGALRFSGVIRYYTNSSLSDFASVNGIFAIEKVSSYIAVIPITVYYSSANFNYIRHDILSSGDKLVTGGFSSTPTTIYNVDMYGIVERF